MHDITPEEAFARGLSDVWLTASGRVQAAIGDDTVPPIHQRFIITLPSGLTILVAYNLARGPRVPLHVGEPVRVRGQYLWNEQGGLIHWTHYDPAMPGGGGWVELPDRKESFS